MLENLLLHISVMFSILRAPGFLKERRKYAKDPRAIFNHQSKAENGGLGMAR